MSMPICEKPRSHTESLTSVVFIVTEWIVGSCFVSINIIDSRADWNALTSACKRIGIEALSTKDSATSGGIVSKWIPGSWPGAFMNTAVVKIVAPTVCTLLRGRVASSCRIISKISFRTVFQASASWIVVEGLIWSCCNVWTGQNTCSIKVFTIKIIIYWAHCNTYHCWVVWPFCRKFRAFNNTKRYSCRGVTPQVAITLIDACLCGNMSPCLLTRYDWTVLNTKVCRIVAKVIGWTLSADYANFRKVVSVVQCYNWSYSVDWICAVAVAKTICMLRIGPWVWVDTFEFAC